MSDTDATTTFDGSTTGTAANPTAPYAPPTYTPSTPAEPEPQPLSPLDFLDAEIKDRDDELEDTIPVPIHGMDSVRLRCSIAVDYDEYKKWQLASLPAKQRNSRKVRPLAMSQLELATLVLLNTCEALEHKVDGRWEPMRSPRTGEVYTLESEELLRRYSVMDPKEFVKRLFGRDAWTITAAEDVMKKSGWLEDDDDDDPTA